MTLRTKCMISWWVFDTDISKPLFFIENVTKSEFVFAFQMGRQSGNSDRHKKKMAIRAVAGRGEKVAGLKKTQCFHRVFVG